MKKRVFVGGIHLESNSFTPLRTRYEDFTFLRGNELVRELAGVQTLVDGGCEIIPSLFADATPGGLVPLADFLKMSAEMLQPLPQDGTVDGVLLILHGALEVEEIGSGEAYLASRVREKVGPSVPISVALDLHGNNTHTLSRLVNLVYGYRTAPHIDVDETRIKAAQLLLRALQEGTLPWTLLQRVPMMLPGESMMTTGGPGAQIIEDLKTLDQMSGVWASSYFAGMPWVDCPQNGSALVVSGTGDTAPVENAMRQMAEQIWSLRDAFCFQGQAMGADEAIAWAQKPERKAPVVLTDSADNVTAGASGDNAYFLQKLLQAKMEKVLVASLIDPAAVAACREAAPGDTLFLRVGRVFDPASVQVELPSVTLKANFPATQQYGRAALVQVDSIDVLLFEQREPVFTEEDLLCFGLKLQDYRTLVVKQGYLSPELTAAAGDVLMVLTPGNCAQDLHLLHYKKIRRPMWPFDAFAWSAR